MDIHSRAGLEHPLCNHYGNAVTTRRTSSLAVTEIAYQPNTRTPPHIHELATFCCILHGSCCEYFDALAMPCTPGDLVFWPAGTTHASTFGNAGAHCLILQPAADWIRDVARQMSLPKEPYVTRAGTLLSVSIRLRQEILQNDPCASLAIEGLALELAACLLRDASSKRKSPVPPWLCRVRAFLDVHFRESVSIADVAEQAGVHPVHLARAFRVYYDCTPSEYVRRLRLEAAAHALAYSESSLLEIALSAGFADQAHFTKSFRRFAGQTPNQFRRTAEMAGGISLSADKTV